jgi:hypothetical protein
MYYFMLIFNRKALNEKFRCINCLPEEGTKSSDWILNGLILKLRNDEELTIDEKLVISVLLNEYANLSIEKKGGLYVVSMSYEMYRQYVDYMEKQYAAEKKKTSGNSSPLTQFKPLK